MPLKFPKLKKLFIDFQSRWAYKMAYIDFTSCSETLESLEFEKFECYTLRDFRGTFEIRHVYNSFAKMSTLKCLSFLQANGFSSEVRHIGSLKSLRLLGIFT